MEDAMPDPDRSAIAAPRSRKPGADARLVQYQPPNASLIGLAKIDFNGWVVARIPIFRRNDGSLSVGAPNAPEVDLDGRQRLRADGKRQFWAVVTFADRAAKERWERSVLTALASAGVDP
jgi:hypothetical protein